MTKILNFALKIKGVVGKNLEKNLERAHGLWINIKCTLMESPIHHQNYIELKTKMAIMMDS